jgi:hypothetical protein
VQLLGMIQTSDEESYVLMFEPASLQSAGVTG